MIKNTADPAHWVNIKQFTWKNTNNKHQKLQPLAHLSLSTWSIGCTPCHFHPDTSGTAQALQGYGSHQHGWRIPAVHGLQRQTFYSEYLRSIKIVSLFACSHYLWDYISSAYGVEELLGDVVLAEGVFQRKIEHVLVSNHVPASLIIICVAF